MAKATLAQVIVPRPDSATPHAVVAWIAAVAAVYAQQTLNSTGTVTGGTFTLAYGGQTTTVLPFDATAKKVRDALNALSTIGPNGVEVTGTLATDDMVVTWNTSGPKTAITADSTLITGGGTIGVVTNTTVGVDGNQIALTGNQLLLVRNTDGAVTYGVTVESSDDPYGRRGHIQGVPIPPSIIKSFCKFPKAGWRQSDGYLYLNAENVAIEFMVLDLTQQPNA